MATETYLHAIVSKMKESLPSDFFGRISKSAAGVAGGKKKSEYHKMTLDEMTPENVKKSDHSKVSGYWRKLNRMYSVAKQDNSPLEPIMGAAHVVMKEMAGRGLNCDPRLELYQMAQKGNKVKKSFSDALELAEDLVVLRNLISISAPAADGQSESPNVGIFLNPRVCKPGFDLVIKAEDISASLIDMLNASEQNVVGRVDNPESAQGDPLYDLVLKKHSLVIKGFETGEGDGGGHAHSLDRYQKTTLKDGAHVHVFLLSDGQMLFTEEDGIHTHDMSDSSADLSGPAGSTHHHTLKVRGSITTEDFSLTEGMILETEEGGEHSHTNLFETTGFNGIHTHTLVLPNGEVVESLSPGDYYRLMGPYQITPDPLPAASFIIGALRRVRYEAMRCEMENAQRMLCEESQDCGPDVMMALAAMGVGQNALVLKEFEETPPKIENSVGEPVEGEVLVQIMKSDNVKKIVYGIVMEAERLDKQDDVISFDELEDAAAQYLVEQRNVAFRHVKPLSINGSAKVIASIVMMAGDVFYGTKLQYGSWIVGVKVEDDNLWEMIQSGEINTFSPGGWSLRRPIA